MLPDEKSKKSTLQTEPTVDTEPHKEAIPEAARELRPSTEILWAIEENPGIKQMLEDIRDYGVTIRAALGPIEDLSGVAGWTVAFAREMELARQTMPRFEASSEIKQMIDAMKHHEAAVRAALGPIDDPRRAAAWAADSVFGREMELARQAMPRFEASSDFKQMIDAMKHDQVALRAMLGPVDDLRRAAAWAADSVIGREMQLAQQTMTAFEAKFRMPNVIESALLIGEFQASRASESLAAMVAVEASSLQHAMESMRTPWLDSREAMSSMAGLMDLQRIGRALESLPAFDESLAATLRVGLGDWRDPIVWRPEILTDLAARSEFYASLGFEQALTNFPSPAFRQGLDIAGLRREPPPLAKNYGAPVPRSADDVKEQGLARTNMAHDWLLRLETRLREFIDDKMTRAFGTDWPKRRLPNGLFEQWQEKKQKAKQVGGKEWPLIAYADFTDYERLICRSDNWREIFATFFDRPEGVRESFQRLYPIRLDTMHARPITQDDELLLYVETRRLVKAIKG